MHLILMGCMFVVSVIFSMLGQGGGALYTPIQVWAGIDFHIAAMTSLFLIIVTSISASIVFYRAKKIDIPMAFALEGITVAGSFIGGFGSHFLSGTILSIVFGAILILASIYMILPMRTRTFSPKTLNRPFIWHRNLGGQIYEVNMAIALSLLFIAGLLSGLLGIGGGLLNIPVMILILGIPIDIAIGLSALMVGLTACGGFAGHLLNGHWDWQLSLILAAAVFAGGQIGSRITLKMNKARLKKGFGWFLMIVAVDMIFRAMP